MKKSSPKNIAASVRQRLLNLSRQRAEDFNLVLTKYALERFLYRLSSSEFRDVFLLSKILCPLFVPNNFRSK